MSSRQAMGIGRGVRQALKHKPAPKPQLAPSKTFVVLHGRTMFEQGEDGRWHRLPWSQFYSTIEVGGKVEVRIATTSEARAISSDTLFGL